MYCIGLTGPVASGKSLAAHTFETLGIPIINADEINRKLIAPFTPAYQAVREHFGDEMLLPNHELNKRLLRQIITHDSAQRLWLESYLHPLIQRDIQAALHVIKDAPYCIIEIPLLTDRKPYPFLNRVLLIQSNETDQLKRLTERDKLSKIDALALINIQPSRSTYKQIADDVVINDKLKSVFIKKIKKLHQQYLQYATQKS